MTHGRSRTCRETANQDSWLLFQLSAAANAVVARLRHNFDDGPYTGPITNREAKLFRYMSNRANVQTLYSESTIQGKKWVLWTLGFNERGSVLQKVKAELDALVAKYPNKVAIVGAWHIEFGKPFSRQVGTQYKIESVEQFGNDPQFTGMNGPSRRFERRWIS